MDPEDVLVDNMGHDDHCRGNVGQDSMAPEDDKVLGN